MSTGLAARREPDRLIQPGPRPGCAAETPGTLPVSDLASPAHERMVRGYLAVLTGEAWAVDDLAQEVFLRAIERLHLVQQYGGGARLLRGIARRVAQEEFRRRRRGRRYVEATLDTLAGDDEAIGAAMLRRETLARLRAAVEDLPVISRRMLELRYHDGKSAMEIGLLLGLQPTAVRVTLLRIRERLRDRMGAGGWAADG